jgi:hypothetical protein
MAIVITRKQVVARTGITASAWRRARGSGRLQPIGAGIYKRSPYFAVADVARAFGLEPRSLEGIGR